VGHAYFQTSCTQPILAGHPVESCRSHTSFWQIIIVMYPPISQVLGFLKTMLGPPKFGAQPALLGLALPPLAHSKTIRDLATHTQTESETQCENKVLMCRLIMNTCAGRQCPNSATIHQGHVCC
jgi:hypothetical protein